MSELFEMNLRPPRCNGCKLARLKHELGSRFLSLSSGIYELDAEPRPGQGQPLSYRGRPIRFRFWGASYRHSNECYNWRPKEVKRKQ